MSRRSNLTYDDGMMLWKTREAYRVQTVVLAVFYLPQFLFALCALWALSRGLWSQVAVYALAIAALWVVRWVLGTLVPRLARWAWVQLRGLCGSRAM